MAAAPLSSPAVSAEQTSEATAHLINYLSNDSSGLEDLHSSLLSSLQRNGWTERVRYVAHELIRNEQCQCFDEMMEVVVALAAGNPTGITPETIVNNRKRKRDEREQQQGHKTARMENGDANGHQTDESPENSFTDADIRIPKSVVGEGVRFLRRAIDDVFWVERAEEEGDDYGDDDDDDDDDGDGGGRNDSVTGGEDATPASTSTVQTSASAGKSHSTPPTKKDPPKKARSKANGKGVNGAKK